MTKDFPRGNGWQARTRWRFGWRGWRRIETLRRTGIPVAAACVVNMKFHIAVGISVGRLVVVGAGAKTIPDGGMSIRWSRTIADLESLWASICTDNNR